MNKINIEASWKKALADEFSKAYFKDLLTFLKEEREAGKVIYPPENLIYDAFEQTPIDKVKVVILGQDPYKKEGEAMGLSFSVPKGVRVPPSLRRIYKELEKDLGCSIPTHGDLTKWATQGVFLLNATLTLEEGLSNSHAKSGWQNFTDVVIKTLSERNEHIVFLLWGGFAKKKKELIDCDRHFVLESAHPSPFTRDMWFDNHHFSKTNEYLQSKGLTPIDWQID